MNALPDRPHACHYCRSAMPRKEDEGDTIFEYLVDDATG